MPRAYTLVLKGTDLARQKGIGGWVFASETTAKAGMLHLPDAAAPTEVRPVELPASLRECAKLDRAIPGLWILTQKAKILPKTAKPKKKAKPRAKKVKGKIKTTLFDLDGP